MNGSMNSPLVMIAVMLAGCSFRTQVSSHDERHASTATELGTTDGITRTAASSEQRSEAGWHLAIEAATEPDGHRDREASVANGEAFVVATEDVRQDESPPQLLNVDRSWNVSIGSINVRFGDNHQHIQVISNIESPTHPKGTAPEVSVRAEQSELPSTPVNPDCDRCMREHEARLAEWLRRFDQPRSIQERRLR